MRSILLAMRLREKAHRRHARIRPLARGAGDARRALGEGGEAVANEYVFHEGLCQEISGLPFRAGRRTVKSLYGSVNAPHNLFFDRCIASTVPELTLTRRTNAVALYQSFLQGRIAAGEPPKGLDQAFAAQLSISPSLWSQIKSARPIGDKLARQIEHHAGQPAGWLDEMHAAVAAQPDAAEERFVEAARAAWRASNAKGKRELLRHVRSMAQDAA
jgi:hypothetical protein